MQWIALTSEKQFENILERSFSRFQVIYKHSSTCGISAKAKKRLEKKSPPPGIDFYFLNIQDNRILSDRVAIDLEVPHQSPQILLIKNKQCVYEESHFGIDMAGISLHSMVA